MRFDNSTKFNLLIVFVFLGLWTCNYFRPKEEKLVVNIGNFEVPKRPCINAINLMFGQGLDSLEICDCLIPKYYDLIKEDSLLEAQFRSSGVFDKLDSLKNDSLGVHLAACARENILDTGYRFKLTSDYESKFKDKLTMCILSKKELEIVNAEILSDCIVRRLNGYMTLGEFFSEDYLEIPRIKEVLSSCFDKSLRTDK